LPLGFSILIDGQQRFTTIFVLLAVVRDKAKATPDSTLCREIEQTLLTNPFKQGNDRFKLLPTQGDRESFLSVCEGRLVSPKTKSREPTDSSSGRSDPPRFSIWKKFMQIIVGQLVLVSKVLERDDNPHLVFESLNAKGRGAFTSGPHPKLLFHADSPAVQNKQNTTLLKGLRRKGIYSVLQLVLV
jgi:hypothetical protein